MKLNPGRNSIFFRSKFDFLSKLQSLYRQNTSPDCFMRTLCAPAPCLTRYCDDIFSPFGKSSLCWLLKQLLLENGRIFITWSREGPHVESPWHGRRAAHGVKALSSPNSNRPWAVVCWQRCLHLIVVLLFLHFSHLTNEKWGRCVQLCLTSKWPFTVLLVFLELNTKTFSVCIERAFKNFLLHARTWIWWFLLFFFPTCIS